MDLRYMQLLCVFVFYMSSLFFVAGAYNNMLLTIMYASAWMFLITGLIIKFDKEDKEEERRMHDQIVYSGYTNS